MNNKIIRLRTNWNYPNTTPFINAPFFAIDKHKFKKQIFNSFML